MATSTVGIRFNIDAGQAKSEVQDLSDVIAQLTQEMKDAQQAGDWKSVATLSQTIDSATSGRGKIMAQANQAQAAAKQDGFFGGQGMWVLQQSLNQIVHGILGAWDAALTAAKQRASGDYTGAAVSQKRATGEIVGQGIGTAVGALGFLGGPVLGMMMMGLGGVIGKAIGAYDSKKLEETLAYSAQYKKAFAGMDSLNQNFGGAVNAKTAEENNQYGLELRGRAVDAAQGTGLNTEAFIEAMGRTASYGIRDELQALNMAQTSALWSRFTGADLSTIQKFGGQAMRYGRESDAVSVAYGGLKASDMGRGQFTEFLNSMERILEEGISKGFVRSTEEIAGNMAMLYRLSGNSPLWQGEQGAQRLSQMNSAISNATNLQSVGDVISYSAARDILNGLVEDNPNTAVNEREQAFRSKYGRDAVYTDSYADVMQILEQGLKADLLKGQWSAVRQLDGDNTGATIERFKEMYGLNYTGASQVWNMYRNAWDSDKGDWREGFNAESYEREIKRLRETPDFRSDSQNLQDVLNRLDHSLVGIGSFKFEEELKILTETQKTIDEILKHLQGGGGPADTSGMSVQEALEVRNQEWTEAEIGSEARGARNRVMEAEFDNQEWRERAMRARTRYGGSMQGAFTTRVDPESQGRMGSYLAQQDKEDSETIMAIVRDAIDSGHMDQLENAEKFMSLMGGVSRNTRNWWNAYDNINLLSNADGIEQLLNALERLIELTRDNGNVRLTVTDLF